MGGGVIQVEQPHRHAAWAHILIPPAAHSNLGPAASARASGSSWVSRGPYGSQDGVKIKWHNAGTPLKT